MNTNSVRLKGNFDVERLNADLKIATEHFQSAPQVGKYHDGSWTGISLRNFSGDHGNTLAAHTGHSKDTAVLKQCAYFKDVLDGLGCPVYVARLLFLPPGKVIGEHVDSGFGWSYGMVRLHIPIITDPKVEFSIGDEEVYWKPGEFWFGDFGKPHSLRNKSDITRVHLVVDCPITADTLALFPTDFLAAVKQETNILEINAVEMEKELLQRYTGTLVVKGPLLGMDLPISGDVYVDDGMLAVRIRGIPMPYHFTPIGDNRFQCNTFELQWPDSFATESSYTVTGTDHKNGKEQTAAIHRKEPVGVKAFSFVQRLIVGGTWRLYFGLLKLKRSLNKNKHVTEQASS